MLGHALAFGLVAVVQAILATLFAHYVCGLDVAGLLWMLGLIAIVDAVLGTALLLASGFAHSLTLRRRTT